MYDILVLYVFFVKNLNFIFTFYYLFYFGFDGLSLLLIHFYQCTSVQQPIIFIHLHVYT